MADPIGFIGLGIMGKPMAKNLVAAGYELVIHNRSQTVIEELAGEYPQVAVARSPREVAERTSLTITMLPDSPDVQIVIFGADGLLEGTRHGSLLVDMSTIAPKTAIDVNEALLARGASALDAPVSGGEPGAINATLSIMAGGSAADFERARPVFEALGTTIVHVGGPGAGQTVKACNQVAVAVIYAAVSEALVLGAKAGVDPEKIIEVLNGGLAASRIMELRGPGMIAGRFQPGFRVNLHRKDLGIIMETGKEYGVALPVTALVSQLFDAVAANGGGDLDHSALITAIEQLSNYSIAEE